LSEAAREDSDSTWFRLREGRAGRANSEEEEEEEFGVEFDVEFEAAETEDDADDEEEVEEEEVKIGVVGGNDESPSSSPESG